MSAPPLISVIIPTIDGRESFYERCVQSYRSCSNNPIEIITLHNEPTCAHGWQKGADQSEGQFIHFTADDLEPHDGWDDAAIAATERGAIPSPYIYGANNQLEFGGSWYQDLPDWTEVPFTSIPFMSRAQWDKIGPMLLVHYYSDNWVGERAKRAGYQILSRKGFAFHHWWAQPGRGAGMTQDRRMMVDQITFNRALAQVDAGTWGTE